MLAPLVLAAVVLAGAAHAASRWRRYGDRSTPTASLSYRGWTIAFFITLAIIELGTFGPPWLPSVHQAGTAAAVHPVLVFFAGLAIFLFFVGYGAGMPHFEPSHGALMRGFMAGLEATLSVALDQLLELPAILALGALIHRRLTHAPLQPLDGLTFVITAAALTVLTRRTWMTAEREVTVKGSRMTIPTRSVAHHVVDAGYIVLGVVLIDWPGAAALIVIPALLIMVRLCASSLRHA